MMELKIRTPDDLHVHLRTGHTMSDVARYTSDVFGRALVMPNTVPPVLTGPDAVRYRESIIDVVGASLREPGQEYKEDLSGLSPRVRPFDPLMTIKIVPSTDAAVVEEARGLGVVAGKLYPEGVTTNSEDGVREVRQLAPAFSAMERCGMVLCLHGERPGVFCMDRETAFLEDLRYISRTFPDLKVVLEHVTTRSAVNCVLSLPSNVAATITAHHLIHTLDDVVGGMLDPHSFCKPIAKTPEDRFALRMAAFNSRHHGSKFFLGTDTAPHRREAKECASGCAGVFSAPCALEVVAGVFELGGALKDLEHFTSEAGAGFYGLPPNEGHVLLRKDPWEVPRSIAGIVPLCAGMTLPWRFAGKVA